MKQNLQNKLKALLERTRDCFKLHIISPEIYNSNILSVLPDYVEILSKIYLYEIDDKYKEKRKGFKYWKNEVLSFHNSEKEELANIYNFFHNERKQIRNPLHHEAWIHRFEVKEREMLKVLDKYLCFLNILFKEELEDLINEIPDYLILKKYIDLKIDAKLKGNRYRFNKLSEAINKKKQEINNLKEKTSSDSGDVEYISVDLESYSPDKHNFLLLFIILRVVPTSEKKICKKILGYPPSLREHVLEVLGNDPIKVSGIKEKLEENFDKKPTKQEIKNCLKDLQETYRLVYKRYDQGKWFLYD